MEAVGQLTGGVAHDFNNLLTVILGNLDLLREEPELAPRAREMADLAIRASLRGADLTRQWLAFSRRQTRESKVLGLPVLVNGNGRLLPRTTSEYLQHLTKLPHTILHHHA